MQTLKFPWQPLTGSIKVTCALARWDGSVIGLSEDGSQFTRVSPDSEWALVGDGERYKSVSQLTDGGLLYVGFDGLLYTLPSLWTGKPPAVTLTLIPGSGVVQAAVQMRNGTIVGLTNEGSLVIRGSLYSDWNSIPNSGTLKHFAVLADDTIVCVGMDSFLYVWCTLTNSWSKQPDSGFVIAVTECGNGDLLGVGTNGLLHKASRVTVGQSSADRMVRSVKVLSSTADVIN